MDILLVLAFLFFIGSILGWVLELFFRRFVSSKKWINPGFLTGPYLPIYGFGLDALYLMSTINLSFISNEVVRNIVLILLMTLAMTLIEYIAGLIFIKGMKVKLWDYSDRWGNVDGIICPLFTVAWGVAGAIYYFGIHPYILNAVNWFVNNLAFSFIIGYFFGIITIDAAHSVKIISKMKAFAKENDILIKYEAMKDHIRDIQLQQKEKINYIMAFDLNSDWKEMLEQYKEKHKDDDNKLQKWRINLFVKNSVTKVVTTTKKAVKTTKKAAKTVSKVAKKKVKPMNKSKIHDTSVSKKTTKENNDDIEQ